MISVKNSFEIAYNGTENECRFELYADTAADLQGLTHFDGIKIQMGSECTDISTGDNYLLNGSGVWVLQPKDNAFTNVYTKAEIDNMSNVIYQTMLYYHTAQESSDGSITFYTLGTPVGSLTIYGNGQQTGTPTPKKPIMPTFCGTLDDSDWTIPITCAGQTVPVYLGQTQTVRKIKKLVLTGDEGTWIKSPKYLGSFYNSLLNTPRQGMPILCSHAVYTSQFTPQTYVYGKCGVDGSGNVKYLDLFIGESSWSVSDFQQYLAAQYAAGTPVTVWYVLETPTTGIVNEPLCKIGDYADELHSTDAAVTIPTVSGENTLTVDTDLIPCKIVISGGE